jgi:hypothetical protein
MKLSATVKEAVAEVEIEVSNEEAARAPRPGTRQDGRLDLLRRALCSERSTKPAVSGEMACHRRCCVM